ncbi:uncharacterized protein BX663DRAFT_494817 [Cokeromyces recurvatus]|uniref:uncharacterized protein n=1 Tax=Cokeromyces recurvatus TaxID=90255 RepID=UPI002220984F|nr:uncharacterized protein BX663DRAFT_494817 [Cokeromyces recurvatus]KAI7907096.1 hypothetical protein BX663DRAFT_494817 [Cokeromyces recurvatus]
MTSILSNNEHSINTNDKNQDTLLQSFIQSKTINDVLNKVKPTCRDLLDLPHTSTIEEAFDLLLAEDILSVPIYYLDEKTKDKKYIAIVSALDLLKLLSTKISMETLQTNSCALLMPLKDAIGVTEPLTILNSADSLRQLLDCFSFEKTHRVLIQQQSNGELVLLSQMDLIRFFQAYNHQLGSDILDLPVSNIKSSGIKSTLNYRSTAAEGFLKLAADDRISALPILDDNGDLIGEISAQDLRGLNRNRWDTLMKPVVMFLKASHGDLYPPLTCHDQFTLSQVMSAFVLRKTYRLWWVDYASFKLKGVISLTDILSTLATII